MRIQLGEPPHTGDLEPASEGLRPIDGPPARIGYWLAVAAGVLVTLGLIMGLITLALLRGQPRQAVDDPLPPTPWSALLLIFLLFVPLHEFLHMAGLPGSGFTPQTILAIWPSKLRFGVYYDGCLSRTRWLWMRAMPFIVLTLLPATALAVFARMDEILNISLQFMMLVNGLGSGGDVIAIALVLRGVPRGGTLCFRAGRAYWKPAAYASPAV